MVRAAAMVHDATGFLRCQGSGFRVQGSGFKVQGSRFKVQGSRFRVQEPAASAVGSHIAQNESQGCCARGIFPIDNGLSSATQQCGLTKQRTCLSVISVISVRSVRSVISVRSRSILRGLPGGYLRSQLPGTRSPPPNLMPPACPVDSYVRRYPEPAHRSPTQCHRLARWILTFAATRNPLTAPQLNATGLPGGFLRSLLPGTRYPGRAHRPPA